MSMNALDWGKTTKERNKNIAAYEKEHKYTLLRDKQQKRLNNLPIAFAFSDKQFEEAKIKLGVTDNDELRSVPGGGIMKATDTHLLYEAFKLSEKEKAEAMKDDEYIYQMFLYELGNHEYGYTYNLFDTLDACGLTRDELESDLRLSGILKKARKKYLDSFED